MIDLHVHSTRSDGTLSPSELVDYAMEKGLSAFALTDHDSVDGLDEAIEYAKNLKENGIDVPEVIPGIEFSTEYYGQDVHVLGLFIDYKCKAFNDYLEEFISSRENRNIKMCQKLTEAGMPVDYEELKEMFKGAVITRAHFAKYMITKGYAKSREEVFDRYIGDYCPFHIPREKVSPKMAVDLILKCDGIPVLAHPILYRMSSENLDKLTGMLKGHGLIGIEGIYTTYTSGEERRIRRLANKYHLLLSGGSDFHGANKPGIDLGVGYGCLHVPEELLDAIKQRRKNLLFSDMDGTLLLSDCTVSAKMKAAIDKMTANGHKLILTSGRPLPSILERIVELGFNYPNMYVISNNGGLIYDMDNDEILYENKLPGQTIRRICEIATEGNVHVHSYTSKEIVGFEDDEELKIYRSRIHMPFIQTDDIGGYLKDGGFKVQIIELYDKSKLDRVKENIEAELGEEVDAFFSNNYYLEILPKNTNKGTGVKFLEDYLAFPHSHTYAAGDENNDIPMIVSAGHGIAMANAKDEVKKSADIVTKNTNNEDGLLEIIEGWK